MAIALEMRKNRRCVFTITLLDSSSVNVVLAAGDVIRVKIGRAGSTPEIDLDSVVASANGSTVTATNPTTVTLDAQDTANMQPGNWDVEVGQYDASQAELLHAETGVFTLLDTQLGDVLGV